ncbi:MAG: hypothetical protein LAO03_15430 [Acidobacteriia bacterium]|nr:hypothetical protein [Terriglobia bacterium]
MRRLIAATVAAFALALAPAVMAQINGVPASVTSIGFGGHFNSPGVPASVTSIGPLGLTPNHVFFTQPCCMQPSFPIVHNHTVFPHRHHDFFPLAVYPYGVPYPVAVPVEVEPEEEYSGGPTVFDRRGSGRYASDRYEDREVREGHDAAETPSEPVAHAEPAPVADQPKTLLIFKDGHHLEVDNYAIIGETLFDLSEGHRRKVPLADLNLAETAKQNDDRGVDFVLPPGSRQN